MAGNKDILETICAAKRQLVAAAEQRMPLRELQARMRDLPSCRGFAERLLAAAETRPAIIAEIKRGSPSLGLVRPDLVPVDLARAYEAGGAVALSVLTDAEFFHTTDADFAAVRAQTAMPMLRKDFMVSPYQIYESRLMGADCVLLIMRVLSDDQAAAMANLARELGMDVLVECFDAAEIERTVRAVPYDLLGINNRNLGTYETNDRHSLALATLVPDRRRLVAESGLKNAAIVAHCWRSGLRLFLIGEAFVMSPDPRSTVAAFVKMSEA